MKIWHVIKWDKCGCEWEYFHMTKQGAVNAANAYGGEELDFKMRNYRTWYVADDWSLEEIEVSET